MLVHNVPGVLLVFTSRKHPVKNNFCNEDESETNKKVTNLHLLSNIWLCPLHLCVQKIFSPLLSKVEDKLWLKTTFSRRRPLVQDKLRWKMTFSGRWPLVEDNFWLKTTFVGRRPLVEDNLWGKVTFIGRQPSVDGNLWWILACYLLPFLAFFREIWKFWKMYPEKNLFCQVLS